MEDSLFLKDIFSAISSLEGYKEAVKRINAGVFPVDIKGLHSSAVDFFIARLHSLGLKLCLVFTTDKEAETAGSALSALGIESAFFPDWGVLPYGEGLRDNAPVFGKRSEVLAELSAGSHDIVLTSLRAFLTPLPPQEEYKKNIIIIKKGSNINPQAVADNLVSMGYLRVPRVSLRGEFALRGEVLDVYPPGMDEAIRIIFEFDTVEKISLFLPDTQRTDKEMEEAVIYPLREHIWKDEHIRALEKSLAEESVKLDTSHITEELSVRGHFSGEEIFYPLAYDKPSNLTEYLPDNAIVVMVHAERLIRAEEALITEYNSLYKRVRHLRPYPHPEKILLPLRQLTHKKRFIRLNSIDSPQGSITINTEGPRAFFGNVNFFKEELQGLIKNKYRIYVITDSRVQKERLAFLLKDYPEIKIELSDVPAGFILPDKKIAVFHEDEIFGRRKRVASSVKKTRSTPIDSFVELSAGDYVVHVQHGIGRFLGIKRMKIGNNERDYLHIEYAGSEYVYVPIEQVNLVQRYIGSSDSEPRLDKIGSSSWKKRKEQVKKSVEDLAKKLIQLYSKRSTARGFAFPPDTEWQMQFEARFPYQETEDQLKCIQEVKEDMESPRPMDRLVCGDVGYGKTEIGMRAAFKAVMGGKQVAFLAPTTILAEQHYENFLERLEGFPVRVEMLSRLVQPARQKQILHDLREGNVDILIGTHKILSKNVQFKDLGLVIIDEEQRFGVKHKERLKELKNSVDCLTLTATPIPRTLHMALLKIRDISVLETPPQERLPIETYIEEFSEERIAEAIRKEVQRGGQVFYLHNRVETLHQIKTFLENIVPEVLVEIAHGQMSPRILEDVMHRFIHGGFHVLVSTTIIENGINIPNANTIIIDRADMYGIAQLYQLRGRVGRSDKAAYAYLFYPAQRQISELAEKRLQVIADHTELGAGFKVALKDLEVRGAGNLLGREQSGDIHSVGFDMYLRLLDQTIREMQKQGEESPEETYMELQYTGYIPDTYISETQEKMLIYKKIVSVDTLEELEALGQELEDRYGPMPPEVSSLLGISELKIIAGKLYITSIKERAGKITIEFGKVSVISPDKALRLIRESNGAIKLDPTHPNRIEITLDNIGLKEKTEYLVIKLSTLL
ncbi:transcription-repair coupling factor [Spirochaetia bacterium 38H-sp]|uniref:Transcription-repair-coupling factor n=1 Tax=Rarispira pelagica TaxID=3141764 RepID=A0ABU9UBB3_9SPIR